MANKVNNPYIELFEQLAIPERLEPKNIAAMLEPKAVQKTPAAKTSSERPARVEAVPAEIKITASGGKHKSSSAYRSVVSAAACAALVFGIAGYMGIDNSEIPSDIRGSGGAYASSYDDVYDMFRRFYIDGAEDKTLDSIIEDIEKSYGENDNTVDETVDPVVDNITDDTDNAPDITESDETDDSDTAYDSQPPAAETVNGEIPLPENYAATDNFGVIFGDGFMLARDGVSIKVFTTQNGGIEYTDNILPSAEENAFSSLVGLYAEGNKAVAVYSQSDSSVEVYIYDITDGKAELASVTVQEGSLIDSSFANGSLYLVTAYSDYRVAPIIDAQDLESYVPSYTVDGVKYYVQASDIMIPDYISTTDYTIISGINVNGDVSVKAVLGCEGRATLINGAVYLFGYDNSDGTDRTSVKVFSLSDGNVVYAGYVNIDGAALGGDGISAIGSSLAVTSIRNDESGYITALGVYDETMNLISKVEFPAALTSAVRYDKKLYLSGTADKYGVDLSEPSVPVLISETPVKNAAEGLVEFDGGYVTLTKAWDGSLILAKIATNENGELYLEYKTTIISAAGATSKALENNGLLFISGNAVGLPYGYFDGVDYCYRYALYRASDNGFEQIGLIESHEVDEIYENGRAVLNGGVLYIFSEGRVYSSSVSETFAVLETADIVDSVYSGH